MESQPSKKEKRIAKKESRYQKQVRRKENPSIAGSSRVPPSFVSQKSTRKKENPDSIMSRKMTWDLSKADKEGEWSWGVKRDWGNETWKDLIYPFLTKMGEKYWSEIVSETTGSKESHKKHHDMDVSLIVKEAQERLIEIHLDQYDVIFRFRLGSKERLWGFRDREYFQIVWYDPTHQIYPTE